MRSSLVLHSVIILILALLPWHSSAQDVVPVPGSQISPSTMPEQEQDAEGANRCLNGYNIVTCSGENAKFAQAYDWIVLILLPLSGVGVFLFGPLLAGRRHWQLVQPITRFWICLLGVMVLTFLALFGAPFVPQASPLRFEVGPLSWLYVDARFIESCLPCRDGVTNPGLLFGRIRWVMPAHGLIPEYPMPIIVVALGGLFTWFLLALLAFIGLRLRTGIGSRAER